ncbi:hypothetical protein QJ856_gp0250 [Tupanvirus deep ocean]|uniref:Uncharacterized protein n=2 Tax=Tupanvirus TaxID=2094720 RepID=A0AC62A9N7_9VIRU|nr:hypothetical protein QJ856_gp0250 [Tupanvirus deep ocean]QKU34481.1 hypothetical protein [Tupanvirus deep ocean]
MSYSTIRRGYTRIQPRRSSPTMSSDIKEELNQPTSSENYSTTNRVSSLMTLCIDNLQRQNPYLIQKIITKMFDPTFDKSLNILKEKTELVVNALNRLLIKSICYTCKHDDYLYLYGGAIRDMLNDEKPHDYDVKVCSEKCAIKFINKLKEYYNVNIIRQHYIGCYSFYVQHTNIPEVEIRFDVTYPTAFSNKNYDIDVNMLKFNISKYGNKVTAINLTNVILINDECNLKHVVRNIHRKQFVVLDNKGRPNTCHNKMWREVIFNESGEVVDCSSFLLKGFNPDNKEIIDSCDCIHRRSQRGRKLLQRIEKMLKRGWTMLNEPCFNPDCVLAQLELVEAYNAYVLEKKEEERRKREEERRKREEKRRKREEERRKYLAALEAKRKREEAANRRFTMGYIPGAVCAKTANRWSYETFTTFHKREQVKKHLTKTKPTSKNRKHGRHSKYSTKHQRLDNNALEC